MIFALAGNQNCGKTTLFNALTGSNQHVGNFPGVTVDQKMGEIRGEKNCSVVDLPGIYSLRPYTQEEIVTRDFILNQKPDGIINIVDATNIERNLYLTLQLLELRVPMVLALNMMDEVRANGGSVDVQKLSAALGIPVVPISAAKGEGVSELMDRAVETAKNRVLPKVYDFCAANSPVHRCVHAVVHLIEDHAERLGLPPRFCATKLIEGDEGILMVSHWPEYDEALNFPAEEASIDAVMDVIRAIRARRAEMNVPPSKKAELMIVTDQAEPYQQGLHFIQRLAYASNVTFPETAPADVTGLVSVVTHDATAYLPLSELVDLAAERERIAKELEKAKNGLRITEGKLANEKFVAHAPENVVNAEREKVAKYQELIAKLEESAKAMA